MHEKPDLPDEQLVEYLWHDYDLPVKQVEFLPTGADVNTAVYRAVAMDGTAYFVKLRSGKFDELTLFVPHLLQELGVPHLIVPLETEDGKYWARLGRFAVTVYPFVEGRDGFAVELTDRQWVELGNTLRRVHCVTLPDDILQRLPRETFSPVYRERVRGYQQTLASATNSDLVASHLAELMRSQEDVIDELIRRADRLAFELQSSSHSLVLCHADIHAGNVLITTDGDLYVVDWDMMVLAPKEHDLMFVGAGVGRTWNTQRESERFYRGYGPANIDPVSVGYYRYECIVEDIAVVCDKILESKFSTQERARSLHYFASQFLPNNVVDIAFRTDQSGLFD